MQREKQAQAEKKKFIVMGIAITGLLLMYLFLYNPFSWFQEGLASGKLLYPRLTATDVNRIELREADGAIVLVNRSGEWQVVGRKIFYQVDKEKNTKKNPLINTEDKVLSLNEGWDKFSAYQVNQSAVDKMISLIKELKEERIVSTKKENFENFELGANPRLQVLLYNANGERIVALLLGKSGSDFSSQYLRKMGEGKVLMASQAMLFHFQKKISDWRDKAIFHIAENTIQNYAYEISQPKKQSLALVKETKAGDDKSKTDKAGNKKETTQEIWREKDKSMVFSNSLINNMLRAFAKLRATDFLPEEDIVKYRDMKNSGRISVKANGTEYALLIVGSYQKPELNSTKPKKKNDTPLQWVVRKDGGKEFYLLSQSQMDSLIKKTDELTEKKKK